MNLSDLISQDHVIAGHKASCKKTLLQDLADEAAKTVGLSGREIFNVLLQRERLGSTGVGNGIAIPHGKLPSIDGMFGIFAKVDKPIDFEALDDEPVDLVFLLLAPEGAGADHLKALARIARVLRDKDTVEKIREASDRETIYQLLTQVPAANAA